MSSNKLLALVSHLSISLTPLNFSLKTGPFRTSILGLYCPQRRTTDKAFALFRRADYRHSEGGRGRAEGDRRLPQVRYEFLDIVHVAEAVSGGISLRCEEAQGAGRREPSSQETGSQSESGQCGAKGCAVKKKVKSAARRSAVGYVMRRYETSQRHACAVMQLYRSSCRYQARPDGNDDLCERLRVMAEARPRCGQDRLHMLVRRQGYLVNHKRTEWLYRGWVCRSVCESGASVPMVFGFRVHYQTDRISDGAWTL